MTPSPVSRDGLPTADRPVEQWIREARAGSKSALGRALETGRKLLLMVANREIDDQLRAKFGASDLVQDTFVAAQRDFGQFRGTTEEEFYGWLTGILAHRLANTVRHYRGVLGRDIDRELAHDAVDNALHAVRDRAPTPGTQSQGSEEQRRVRMALQQLEEPWRSVLIERTWRDQSFAAIGALHNCSDEAARKIWARAVRRLRQILAELE